MRQMLVKCDQMRNVDVAVILLREHIFSYLIAVTESEDLFSRIFATVIPVDVDVLEMEFEHSDILVLTKQTERVHRLPVHCALIVLARGMLSEVKVQRGRRALQGDATALMHAIRPKEGR